MKKGYVAIVVLVLTVTMLSMSFKGVEHFAYKQRLSEYGLFEGKISNQQTDKKCNALFTQFAIVFRLCPQIALCTVAQW